ncbi:uncharacterized protein BT62DRAFT_913161, partial [Guyanagaster necrorhizus]
DFQSGDLVLMHNTQIEKALNSEFSIMNQPFLCASKNKYFHILIFIVGYWTILLAQKHITMLVCD